MPALGRDVLLGIFEFLGLIGENSSFTNGMFFDGGGGFNWSGLEADNGMTET